MNACDVAWITAPDQGALDIWSSGQADARARLPTGGRDPESPGAQAQRTAANASSTNTQPRPVASAPQLSTSGSPVRCTTVTEPGRIGVADRSRNSSSDPG